MRIQVIHGPNLNLLGTREPALYGEVTLEEIDRTLVALGGADGITVECFQSNHEGEIVEVIQKTRGHCDGMILNAAAYAHTSIAIRDALLAAEVPMVEVHLTNLARREDFRRRTLTADVAIGQINGFGAYGYELALAALVNHLNR